MRQPRKDDFRRRNFHGPHRSALVDYNIACLHLGVYQSGADCAVSKMEEAPSGWDKSLITGSEHCFWCPSKVTDPGVPQSVSGGGGRRFAG